jgi:polyphosphate kinase 2 (PPK2 family)
MMLEQVDLDQKLTKNEFEERMPALRGRLYDLQMRCREARVPSLLVFEGWAGAGKRTVMHTLTSRLDPRYFKLYSIEPPRTAELEMPWLWRFWSKLPRYGEMAVFYRSWYRRTVATRVRKNSEQEWVRRCRDIEDFERCLAEDGAVFMKLFLHISQEEQAKRLKKLEKDPLTRWRVTPQDKKQNQKYSKYYKAIEETLAQTESEWAPWMIVEATDRQWTHYRVFETVVRRLEEGLRRHGVDPNSIEPPRAAPVARES